MNEMKTSLPEFERPPVSEVAIRVQFQDIVGLDSMHIGILWNENYKDNFPETQEHPPLVKIEESFGQIDRPPIFQLQFGPQPSRYWFLNNDNTEILQIQRDCFAHNWRNEGKKIQYPRFSSIRKTFIENLEQLQEFICEKKLGSFEPSLCEVTYVNELVCGNGWNSHEDLGQITPLSGTTNEEFLPKLENASISTRFLMLNDNKKPLGRLHVSISPANKKDEGVPVYLLTLIARGEPIGNGIEGAANFIDIGHEWIVRGFADVTTSHMHTIWGRKS